MYNKRLDTFIKAAECGSFSGAAEQLFITPSAVIQQINHLEQQMNVQFFRRTNQGIVLTEAGEYFYREALEYVRKSNEIQRGLDLFREKQQHTIRVLTNVFHQPMLLYELWFDYYMAHPDDQIQTHNFEGDGYSARQNADLIEGVYFRESWQSSFEFIKAIEVPFCIGLTADHPLSGKNFLTIADLTGETVITIPQGIDQAQDRAREYLSGHGVRLSEVLIYDSSVVIQCMTKKQCILIPESWRSLHPQLKLLPVDWKFTADYGFYVSKTPSSAASVFIQYIRSRYPQN